MSGILQFLDFATKGPRWVSSNDPLPVTVTSGGGGAPTVIAGADGTGAASANNPLPVYSAQGLIASGPITLVAATAQTIIGAFAGRRGIRVLNWTASPVYIGEGTTGTPASGAGSDFIPAAASGVPGQWEPPYAPVNGLRAVGASAGGLTVTAW
jgi:hypothetical protein